MGELKNNIYWINDTEDKESYIGMQAPYRGLSYQPIWCFPKHNKCCPKRKKDCVEIDMSNNIDIKAETSADIELEGIKDSTIGDVTGGSASTSVTVDAVQVSVVVVVPIIDSFDHDEPYGPPSNGVSSAPGRYRVGAAGQNLDIQVNGDGTATINGVPAEQSELANGTKVYIYKKDEQKGVEETSVK